MPFFEVETVTFLLAKNAMTSLLSRVGFNVTGGNPFIYRGFVNLLTRV
jgi:hypothetical protein